jgi:hypothetical protein
MPAAPRSDNKKAPPKRARQPRRGRLKNEEARLDQAIQSVLGKGPEDYTPEQWQGLREQTRLTPLS